LLDRDEDFLYQNDYFKGIIRRIYCNYNHLVNPIYEIDSNLLKANKNVDFKYEIFDKP
jgi:hypothetical protein